MSLQLTHPGNASLFYPLCFAKRVEKRIILIFLRILQQNYFYFLPSLREAKRGQTSVA